MRDYADVLKQARTCANRKYCDLGGNCEYYDLDVCCQGSEKDILQDAADAIEELVRIGSKMHTWIFLHTTDEQAAYDEIGLTKEQNAMFGYSGQMILKADPPKEVEYCTGLSMRLRRAFEADELVNQRILLDAADAIEELVTVCREIAAFVIHYADDDEVSAEVLCRKLHKIGLIEKDGAWWTLPDPPKEVE